jgi:chaperone modulatory protein CbpM
VITLTTIYRAVPGLTEAELTQFIDADWVRPVRRGNKPFFTELDLARIRLILDLRATLEVEEETLPIVLSLLDQLYATRRQLRRVIDEAGPEIRQRLAALLQDG